MLKNFCGAFALILLNIDICLKIYLFIDIGSGGTANAIQA
jgi:hypothetical protein